MINAKWKNKWCAILSLCTEHFHWNLSTIILNMDVYIYIVYMNVVKESKLLNSNWMMLNQILSSGCEYVHPEFPIYTFLPSFLYSRYQWQYNLSLVSCQTLPKYSCDPLVLMTYTETVLFFKIYWFTQTIMF